MRLRHKLLLVTLVAVPLAVGAALMTLAAIGRSRGVLRVPLPSGSIIADVANDADYADSYMAVVPAILFPDTRALDRFAFQRCTPAGETADEIMYTGESPGLVYHISYLRRREGSEAKLFVSTTVHYKSWRGWFYFALVRPGHRRLGPFMVSAMIRQARAAAM